LALMLNCGNLLPRCIRERRKRRTREADSIDARHRDGQVRSSEDASIMECGLEINSGKSRIVYCKDKNRQEEHETISFDFLGFTFRPRRCLRNSGPLSTRSTSGSPRSLRSRSNIRIRRLPVIEVSTSTARHCRLKSSMTLNVLNLLPACRPSLIKSAD
jgi:hypothetical protein